MRSTADGDAILRDGTRTREVVCELARRFYALGWASGTGGGISIREGERIFMAPSGVQKELIAPEDLFVLDPAGNVVEAPRDSSLRLSACAPLFLHAFRKRGAGAVLHSHSLRAMLATLVAQGDTFRATHLEMIKGLEGHGYHDEVVIPILENVAHECDLADALGAAIDAHPRACAVLVRRHGVYVWGRDWRQAKTQAECLDYLFAAPVQMRGLGLAAAAPERKGTRPRRRCAARRWNWCGRSADRCLRQNRRWNMGWPVIWPEAPITRITTIRRVSASSMTWR